MERMEKHLYLKSYIGNQRSRIACDMEKEKEYEKEMRTADE